MGTADGIDRNGGLEGANELLGASIRWKGAF